MSELKETKKIKVIPQLQKQLVRAQKVKNDPNIKSKSNARVEGNIENESCSTT